MKLFTVKELSEKLGVHENTIYNYIYIGKLKAFRIGGNYRITEQAIEDFLISSSL